MRNIKGIFVDGTIIKGNSSGANWSLANANEMENSVTEFDDNFRIETEADGILDFSETNPFGEP